MKKIISTVLLCVLLCGCMFALASCGAPNSDPKAAAEALKEEGYVVTLNESPVGYKATIVATKNNVKEKEFEYVEIYYFNSEADAETAFDTLSTKFSAEAEELKGTDYEIEYGISGSLIYKGTSGAIKAAK